MDNHVFYNSLTKATMSKKTQLSELELLIKWLNSANNRNRTECDQFFAAYYNMIAKKLTFYITYEYNVSNALAQDILQEIMLNVFVQIKDRTVYAKNVDEYIEQSKQFNLSNPFFEKRIHSWFSDVIFWTEEAIIFPLENTQTKSPLLDEEVKKLNTKMNPLKKECKAIKESSKEGDAVSFISNADDVLKLLSKIRIPTSSLFYIEADNKTTDFARKKSTKMEVSLDSDCDAEDEDDAQNFKIEADVQGYEKWLSDQRLGLIDELDNEEQLLQESVEFLLQTPIRVVEEALKNATSKQEKIRCEDKLEKVKVRYFNNLMILEMMKNDYSQESIAANLGWKRDQVRTCLEQIKMLLTPLKGRKLP
jgi:hypothetical protein